MRLPFAIAEVHFGPAERDEAIVYFRSKLGQSLLSALEAMRPAPAKNGRSEEVAQQAKLIEGYELVFQNIEVLLTPPQRAASVAPAYPDPDDDKAWTDSKLNEPN